MSKALGCKVWGNQQQTMSLTQRTPNRTFWFSLYDNNRSWVQVELWISDNWFIRISTVSRVCIQTANPTNLIRHLGLVFCLLMRWVGLGPKIYIYIKAWVGSGSDLQNFQPELTHTINSFKNYMHFMFVNLIYFGLWVLV